MRTKKKRQAACKPGSVVTAISGADGHSSGMAVTSHLVQPTRMAGRKPPWPEGRPSLFGLAPGGVYPADAVTGIAVRSYRTLSPLPRQAAAVCFLWHFPWGRPRRTLSGTMLPWSPDFPHPEGRGHPAA